MYVIQGVSKEGLGEIHLITGFKVSCRNDAGEEASGQQGLAESA